MLIDRKTNRIVLRLKTPEAVTSIIPKSKVFIHEGKQFVAVHHGLEETKVLRNIGIMAPSPITYQYKWPGRFQPFKVQKEAAAYMTLHPRAFNLSDLGTGKTMATLWGYDYLRSLNMVSRALVITPLSTLEMTWESEVYTHFPHLNAAVVYGDKETRLKILGTKADIYLINHDGLKVPGIVEHLKGRQDIDLIVIDEIAQVGRNAGTDRWRALNEVCNKQTKRRVWGLTGSPTPNAPTDAWAQCRLLVPSNVPPYFNRFRDTVMRQINQFSWVPRAESTDIVYNVMQPAIRYSRDECVDLPPVMYSTRSVVLSPEQDKAYRSMLNTLCIQAAQGKITAANEAIKAQKLIQVACGIVYDGNGGEAAFNAGPRIKALLEVMEHSSAKVIVFVPFVSSLQMVAQELRAVHDKINFTRHSLGGKGIDDKIEVVYGDTTKNERTRIFTTFQKEDHLRCIVAQPSAMSHGLTLTEANTIVWYAPITSSEVFIQANARITRPGQRKDQFIVMLEGTPIERRYYARLKNKEKVQGVFLDMVKEHRVEVDMV